nr:phytanoyl-CoA dioxygenase family protein [Kitasatospora mediocidica]
MAQLRDQGWCLVPGVMPEDEIPLVHDLILAEERAQAQARGESWTRTSNGSTDTTRYQRVSKAAAIVARLGAHASFVADDRVLGAVRRLLGEYVRVSSDFGIVTLPGAERGFWHCDWPYNQTVAAHIPQPYGDMVMHLSALFMVTDFTEENGGTLLVPGSHRRPGNPTGDNDELAATPQSGELQVTGRRGSAILFDARLWHAVAPNTSDQTRVALAVRYAPWWLNLEVRRPGSTDARLVEELMDGRANSAPLLTAAQFEALPAVLRPMYENWVEQP